MPEALFSSVGSQPIHEGDKDTGAEADESFPSVRLAAYASRYDNQQRSGKLALGWIMVTTVGREVASVRYFVSGKSGFQRRLFRRASLQNTLVTMMFCLIIGRSTINSRQLYAVDRPGRNTQKDSDKATAQTWLLSASVQ